MKKRIAFLIACLFIISACTPKGSESSISDSDLESPTFTVQPSFTTEPTDTPVPPTETPCLQTQICSPLEGEALSELPEIITQPFKPPRAGQDVENDDHHGIDFAFYRRKDMLSIDGLPILSVLDGEIVTIINDKYPYGNALIIETPLDSISLILLDQLNLPSIQPTVVPDPKFNWSPGELPFQLSETSKSLYICYAHLKYPTDVNVGDKVSCGQQIGQVGNTGDSSNPHLHFETRIGPSGARFESMAYYTAQSTQSERYNYVVWRVSNMFQLFDPMVLLSIN
jgi:murein DD-endopeptidase MepM/ murein hydrolase activator NlpD